jgi:tetratricopeptide (TPR) repeat protein
VKIGPYEVLGEVGRGGMGVVYRVRAPGDERPRALKLLLKMDLDAFARFDRERRLHGALGEEHGFVGLLDAGLSEGLSERRAWLVMPFVPGGTLRDRLAKGPLGIDETIALGIELATALGKAHERGIVHRDVKPENILFAASGRALLTDLGLAKHFDRNALGASESLGITRSGVIHGTVGYMAPEQLEDASAVGPAADVFALGAVLSECLTGRPAFAGEGVLEMLAKLSSGERDPIDRDGVPSWLAAAVKKSLAGTPRARFADGASFARALEEGRSGATAARFRRRVAVTGALLVTALAGVVAIALRLAHAGPSAQELAELARAKLVTPDRDGAISLASKAIELDPKLALAWAVRAVARGFKEDWEGDRADSARALELDPGLALAWAAHGAPRAHAGDYDGAVADETKALEIDPRTALAWFNRGVTRCAKGEVAGALADIEHGLALEPRFAFGWANRANLRALKGDVDGAIADLSKAIELEPVASYLEQRGIYRGGKGDSDGAIADYTRAIETAPRDARSWLDRGVTWGNKGDVARALADLTKAVELDPRRAQAWLERGVVRLRENDIDGTIEDETRAIELDPSLPRAWANRASARDRKGDLDEGIADVTKAIELDPKLAFAWGERGVARGLKGDFEGEVADETKAIELGPGMPGPWRTRGHGRARSGDWAGAIADLEHYLELAPDSPDRTLVTRDLEEARKHVR